MISNITILNEELLSDNWYILKKYTYEYNKEDGTRHMQIREAYNRGNGAAILLYNQEKNTVVLTRQFRLPTYVNGNASGMLIEVCAGLLDEDSPEDCIRRETQEETGYLIKEVKKVFEAYMSPGSVTEILYFFIPEYTHSMKVSEGGGADHEEENIEVMEVEFNEAISQMKAGEIRDAKTIMLIQYAMINGLLVQNV